MLLSIDDAKVKAEVAREQPSYRVTALNLELPMEGYSAPAITTVTAVMTMPPDLQKANELLMELRQRLIQKGEKLLSPDELEQLINETRGR
jgi:hypothetical protein